MWGSKDNSALAAQMFYSKWQFWGRAQIFKQINRDTIGWKYIGDHFCQDFAIVPAIISNGDFQFFIRKWLVHIIAQPLRIFP